MSQTVVANINIIDCCILSFLATKTKLAALVVSVQEQIFFLGLNYKMKIVLLSFFKKLDCFVQC